MGQSLVQNYVHIIFSTKNHQKLIHPSIENELFNYLGGSCKELGCQPLKVGGHSDHIHILCMLAKNVTIVDLLKNIKSSSSKWIKTKGDGFKDFCKTVMDHLRLIRMMSIWLVITSAINIIIIKK